MMKYLWTCASCAGVKRLEEVLCELIRLRRTWRWTRQYAPSAVERWHKRGSVNLRKGKWVPSQSKVEKWMSTGTYLSPDAMRNKSLILLWISQHTACFYFPHTSPSKHKPSSFIPLSPFSRCVPSCLPHYSSSSPFPPELWNESHFIVREKNENTRHRGTQSRLLTVMGLWGGDRILK